MNKKVYAIGAHPDDVEQGAGILLQRLRAHGFDVHVIACTFGKDDVLVREMNDAMAALGISSFTIMENDVNTLPDVRRALCDTFYHLGQDHDPAIVISPSVHDKHQDHKAVAEEVVRAFNTCSILQYPFLRNQPHGNHVNVFIEPTKEEIDKKMDAIDCYKSQTWREWSSANVNLACMTVWGSYIRRPYAEAYECVRGIMFGL
jgi:LmbE family N-acetylglucosaminyl deacetylase